MNDYVVTLSKLKYDKKACLEFFNTLDFDVRWDDRPSGKYIRAKNPDNLFEIPCIKEIKDQIPWVKNFQFIKIQKNWEMPIHIDTFRTAVLMIPLSDSPAPTFWYEEPDHIKELRLSGDRDGYIKASKKLDIEPIYTHIQDGTPCVINAAIPHNTNTHNGIDRLTIQIGMASIQNGPFQTWEEVNQSLLERQLL
jgi:hypothetical protein